MKKINSQLFWEMLIAARDRLGEKVSLVNSLNVFPVPDGDTGINLFLTISSGLKKGSESNANFTSAAKIFASETLRQARGNSGVILSQFFLGFLEERGEREEIDAREFIECYLRGVELAYQVLFRPVEGTILTVMRKAGEKGKLLLEKGENEITKILSGMLAAAKEALFETPQLLPVLAQAGVVDAGGCGFYFLLEGATRRIYPHLPVTEIEFKLPKMEVLSSNLAGLYCLEFTLEGKELNISQIENHLSHSGNSLVVAGDKKLARIHIHCSQPCALLEQMVSFGLVSTVQLKDIETERKEFLATTASSLQAIITVACGEGFTKIFLSLGADVVIDGGQTMNPAVAQFIESIQGLTAPTVFIVPNNSNIFLPAQQAQKISSRKVIIIPSKSIPQGLSALLAFDPSKTPQENKKNMSQALRTVKTGGITIAIRSARYANLRVKSGDIIGLLDGKIAVKGKELCPVTLQLIEKMVSPSDEIITMFYNQEVTPENVGNLQNEMKTKFPRLEVEFQYGGQPHYFFIISVS